MSIPNMTKERGRIDANMYLADRDVVYGCLTISWSSSEGISQCWRVRDGVTGCCDDDDGVEIDVSRIPRPPYE